MAIATGTAIALSAGIGGLSGILGSRDARKAAQAAGQPQRFDETSQLTPYGPTQSILDMIMASIGPSLQGGFDTLGGLEFPEYQGFSFSPIGVNIPGASAKTKAILAEIQALYQNGSPFLDLAEEKLPELIESLESREGIEPLVALLQQGVLADTLAGKYVEAGNPFEDEVVGSLTATLEEAYDRQEEALRSEAAGIGRSGSGEAGPAISDLRSSFVEELAAAVGALKAGNYAQERGLQGQAIGQAGAIASQIGSLDQQRLGQLGNALALTPQLEQARFIGPGLAGDLSSNIDRTNQAARMAEAQAAVQQHIFGGQVGLANAAGQNQFNLAELDFNRQQAFDPMLLLGGALDLTMPLATAFGTNRRYGYNQGPTPYAPGGFSSGLTGALGGLALGGGLAGLGLFGGGGNFNQKLAGATGLTPWQLALGMMQGG